MITKPVSWESMDSIEVTFVIMRMDSTLISFLKVMANMQEMAALEVVTEISMFDVSSHQACEPVVRDADGRLNLSVATVF